MLALKTFTFNPIQENTYLLYNEKKECCIIDPGCYFPEERDELRTGIEKTGLTPVMLLNTHCHLDHVFGNQFVFDTWGLLPHLHINEQQVLQRAGESGERWQLPFTNYTGELVFIDESTDLRMGEDVLQVLLTPGHSPGSLSFYHAAGKFVIGGDVLFNGSVGRTDLPGGNHAVLIETIREKLLPLPDETVVHSGHGPSTTIGKERRNNPYLQNV